MFDQATNNAIRSLAINAIEAHESEKKRIGRKLDMHETKAVISPYREKASIITNGKCDAVYFNYVVSRIFRGLDV